VNDSVIERSFFRADHRIPAQARSMLESSESVRIVALAIKPETMHTLMPQISGVWAEVYKPVRHGGFHRIDEGRARKRTTPQKLGKPTERAFIKHRRAAATEVVSPGAALQVDCELGPDACGDAWTVRHGAELEFNRKKRQGRLVEALFSNSLLEDEIADGVMDEAIQPVNQNTKNRAKRARREATVLANVVKGRIPSLEEFRAQHALIDDAGHTTKLDECMAMQGWELATVEQASLIITPALTPHILRCAMLNGAWVVQPEWAAALSVGPDYNSWDIKFMQATSTRRLIWISAAARREEPLAAAAVEQATTRHGSKWRLAESLEEWAVRKQAAMGQNNSSGVIVFVTGTWDPDPGTGPRTGTVTWDPGPGTGPGTGTVTWDRVRG